MGAQSNVAPVIIKKKKVSGGDGHHGGAWKVAYADFVTAMMAFFMLMWLLNATTEQQRKGIADYFSPTIAVTRISGGGDGALYGDSVTAEKALAKSGIAATRHYDPRGDTGRGDSGLEDDARTAEAFSSVETVLKGMSGESMVEDALLQHVITKVTDEGLIIELFDLPGRPLFEGDTDRATPLLRDLARLVVHAAALVTNDLAVGGHVRSYPAPLADNPIWDLSSGRADRLRQILEDQGEDPARIRRVVGHADRNLVLHDPLSPRNNRMEVILLRH